MRKDKKAMLIALSLGDGHLRLTKNGNGAVNKSTAQLALLHSTAQLNYMEWKVAKLHSLLGGKKPNISTRKTRNKGNGKTYERCEANKSHKYFRVLRKWMYKDGKKIITKDLLQYLTPEAIAVWVMDDGGMKKYRNKKGEISSCQFYLATYVSEQEALDIQEYFLDTWDIDFKIRKVKDKYMHYTNTAGTRKLCDLVRDHVIPSMSYKLV